MIYENLKSTEEDYKFGLAVELKQDKQIELAQGMYSFYFPAMKVAQVEHVGHDNQLSEIGTYLFQHWLPQNGYQAAEFPMIIERLSFYPDVPANQAHSKIYVAIK